MDAGALRASLAGREPVDEELLPLLQRVFGTSKRRTADPQAFDRV